MAAQKISTPEKIIWTLIVVPLDLICIFLGITLVLGLLGWVIKMFGKFSLSLYFLMKMGPNYFGGKRAGQKIAITLISAIVDAAPELDDFIPSLTIELWAMYLTLDKEAEEAVAANDNKKQNLSRAA